MNPDELLNQDVKSNALGRTRPRNQTELMDNVRSDLRSPRKQPRIVKNDFQKKRRELRRISANSSPLTAPG